MIESSTDDMYMNIRLSRLLDSGIRAVIMNKKDTSYNAFGFIELHVHRDDFLKAKYLLEINESE